MRILFETFKYPKDNQAVKESTQGLYPISKGNKQISVDRVGYFFNPQLNEGRGDIVFILPKVFLNKVDKSWLVFGRDPLDFVNTDLKKWSEGDDEIKDKNIISRKFVADFIFGFSIWVYRAIKIYDERLKDQRQNDGIDENGENLEFSSINVGKDDNRINNTLMDILLAIQEYNISNQAFITYTIKNLHSGYNRINWTRTISHSTAYIQNDIPIYLNPVNKKRIINFDEELLVIFFSILNYMNVHYCFNEKIPFGYELIKGKKFDNYIKSQGRIRLLSIKHKYFSDNAVRMWQLCYAFFDKQRSIGLKSDKQEYLLVNKFETVFEDMIDALIGDDNLPEGLKVSGDDKRIDHLYTYNDLLENHNNREIYYIGDSKYYPMGKGAEGHDAPKQFTYARNTIQWHLDLINGVEPDGVRNLKVWDKQTEKFKKVPLYDQVTEGYNVIPNFFISGIVKEGNYNYDEKNGGLEVSDRPDQIPHQWQFIDRIFDRSSLFLSHYDVNFLFVLKKYARLKKRSEVEDFKNSARKMFRDYIINLLNKHFSLYQVNLPEMVNIGEFVHEHFYDLHGRVFSFGEEDEKVLLYAEPNETELAEIERFHTTKSLKIDSFISNDKLLLDNGNIAVDVSKIKFGEDISKQIGAITYKVQDINSILKKIQDDNPDIDIQKAVEIISADNVIHTSQKHIGINYVYDDELNVPSMAAENSTYVEITDDSIKGNEFIFEINKYYEDDFDESERFIKYLPVTTVKAACGQFLDNDPMEIDYWIDAEECGCRQHGKDIYIVKAQGHSMEDKIHDGDLCVFQMGCSYYPGDIVLACITDRDPNYGGRFTIKKYDREKNIEDGEYVRTKVFLSSINSDYPNYEFTKNDESVGIVGVFKDIIRTSVDKR